MKFIKLTQGKFTQVNDSDYEWLNQWKWQVAKNRNTYYAARSKWIPEIHKIKTISMHRLILNTPDDLKADHIDHDGLNNQRYNLRNCNNSQNGANRNPGGKSGYLGVTIQKQKYGSSLIRAQITTNKKLIHLGSFKTKESAARKYDEMAKIYHGEFANLNFK